MQIVPAETFKNTAQNSPKHAISCEKSILFSGGSPPQTPTLVDPTPPRPKQAFWIHICVSSHIHAHGFGLVHKSTLSRCTDTAGITKSKSAYDIFFSALRWSKFAASPDLAYPRVVQ